MSAARIKRRRVLLIGDDPLLAEWAQQFSADPDKYLDFTVLPVGEDVPPWLAMATVRKLPHLVVLDLQLPKLDGLAVLRTLRNHLSTRTTPIVAFSAEFTQEDVQMGYKVGANICVSKPSSFEEFSSMLEEQLAYWLEPQQRAKAQARAQA